MLGVEVVLVELDVEEGSMLGSALRVENESLIGVGLLLMLPF
jgi:hypothetical protein